MWELNNIRLGFFLVEPLARELDVWRSFFGFEPEEESHRRDGTRSAAGPFRSGAASINVSPIRLDIQVGPPPVQVAPGMAPDAQLTIGEAEAELAAFAELVRAWLPTFTTRFSRLAFAGTVIAKVTDPVEGYEILKDNLLSLKVEPGLMSDLLYRVNWRRPSVISDIKFYNRLTTWSSNELRMEANSPQGSFRTVRYFANLDIDINTPADRMLPIDQSSTRAIFDEMLALTYENLRHGEQR